MSDIERPKGSTEYPLIPLSDDNIAVASSRAPEQLKLPRTSLVKNAVKLANADIEGKAVVSATGQSLTATYSISNVRPLAVSAVH